MNQRHQTAGGPADPGMMRKIHQDLEESKRSVRRLLEFRRTQYNSNTRSADLDVYMEKALEAIDHLFEDEIGE